MYFSKEGKFVRTDIWREGDYLDLWSVPHFLSGMAIAMGLFLLGFATNAALIIAFLLLVAYEMFEVIAEIEETRWNRILDVVVGMISFIPTFLIAPQFSSSIIIGTFILVLIVDCTLSYFGWLASHKASTLESKLRAEFEKEKVRFARRREMVLTKWDGRKKRWRAQRAARISLRRGENAEKS